MPKPKFQGPAQYTPKVVSQGTLSKPSAQPRVSFQGPAAQPGRVVGTPPTARPVGSA